MNITSGKFEADLFVMANATNFKTLVSGTDEYAMMVTENLTPNASYEVTLTHTPLAATISIAYPDNGTNHGQMSSSGTSDPTAGQYKIVTSSGTTKLVFASADITAGVPVTVSYYYDLTPEIDGTGEYVQEAKIDNRSSAIGEAILMWPVYGSGDDCSDSSIIGNVIVKVYKCRVTAAPGFDSSYKTANTFQFTLAAMDAKRSDNNTYSIAFVRKDSGIA